MQMSQIGIIFDNHQKLNYTLMSQIGTEEKAMVVKYQNSMQYKLLERIKTLPNNIILRADIESLGDRRQVSRALNKLTNDEKLIKLSFGIYAKTKKSSISGRTLLIEPFTILVKEALNRLRIKWTFTSDQKAYNEGKTTQLPVKPSLRLKNRCRRKFSYGKNIFYFEDDIYAK